MRYPIDEVEQRTEAVHPPGVACARECIPTVVGIAPQLPGRAEVVRRNTGDHCWPAVRLELKPLGPRPDVGAVVGDKDREIAHDVDRACVARLAYAVPLLEEEELRQLVQLNLLLPPGRPPRDGRRFAPCDIGFPHRPRHVLVPGFDRHEEGVVIQPGALRGAEAVEPVAQRGGRTGKALEHSRPERLTMRNHPRVVDQSIVKAKGAAKLRSGKQVLLDQQVEADEEGIAGKRGKTLVRRIAVACRAERQYLPQALPGFGQDIDELVRAAAEVADAKRARE